MSEAEVGLELGEALAKQALFAFLGGPDLLFQFIVVFAREQFSMVFRRLPRFKLGGLVIPEQLPHLGRTFNVLLDPCVVTGFLIDLGLLCRLLLILI